MQVQEQEKYLLILDFFFFGIQLTESCPLSVVPSSLAHARRRGVGLTRAGNCAWSCGAGAEVPRAELIWGRPKRGDGPVPPTKELRTTVELHHDVGSQLERYKVFNNADV